MRVTCTNTNADDFPAHYAPFIKGVYNITQGREYIVVGMGLWQDNNQRNWQNQLLFLIEGDAGHPHWVPSNAFGGNTQELPSDWHFYCEDITVTSKNPLAPHWIAIWGYSELVDGGAHVDRLIERQEPALAIFKRELERQSEEF